MLFTSFPFVIFFLVVFGIYYLPALHPFQVRILIVASFAFYGSGNPTLLLLLFFSILINSVVSFQISFSTTAKKRIWALCGVITNISLLAFFKYAGFLTRTFQSLD